MSVVSRLAVQVLARVAGGVLIPPKGPSRLVELLLQPLVVMAVVGGPAVQVQAGVSVGVLFPPGAQLTG